MDIYEAGKKLLCGGYTQYTPDGASYFQNAGRWSKLPEKGAVLYNYIKSQRRIAHTGIVIDVDMNHQNRIFSIKTVEGNTSAKTWENNGGMVAIKEYNNIPFDSIGKGTESHIQGFGVPRFSSETCGYKDFIDIAKAEVGYVEKSSPIYIGNIEELATDTEKTQGSGTANYTKYGKWYKYNGVAWCQQFVSWCAYMACKKYQDSKWEHDTTTNKWYYIQNGKRVKDKWLYIDDRWYVFDAEGAMLTNTWFKQNKEGLDEWYYLGEDGGMLSSQWFFYKNKWYYLTKTGLMATSAYIKDRGAYCYVNENGIWDEKYVLSPGPMGEVVD